MSLINTGWVVVKWDTLIELQSLQPDVFRLKGTELLCMPCASAQESAPGCVAEGLWGAAHFITCLEATQDSSR